MSCIISKRALNMLRRIKVSEEQDLVYETGAGWWVGFDRVAGRDAKELILFCLISDDSQYAFGSGFERWSINEDGERLLRDTAYVPRIVAAMEGAKNG